MDENAANVVMANVMELHRKIECLEAALDECGRSVGPCAPCSLCDGGHHWLESAPDMLSDEGEPLPPNHPLVIAGIEAFYICKHCPAWTINLREDEEWD